mgnify:CR=1 FL=1|tara:strand:- start:6310 stop:6501 length:192 start_codon:yes stop_codon:yes gene_type:complete
MKIVIRVLLTLIGMALIGLIIAFMGWLTNNHGELVGQIMITIVVLIVFSVFFYLIYSLIKKIF